jgi:tetratricopeptide (TPR) repeat protein
MEKREVSGSNAKDWYERGQHLSQNARHKEAIEALDKAIAKDPVHAEAYFARGACYYALGRYDRAGDDIDAAAILGCRDAQFWSKHAVYSSTKDADKEQNH